jgi:cysteine desulfurase/selenocysteine lyase
MSSMHKEDFIIFENFKNNPDNKSGSDLVYLDNASTSQTPTQVLSAISYYYTNHKSNIDRGLYTLEETSTQKYEETRKAFAKFLNVDSSEIIFTSGATDSSNKLVLIMEKHLAKYPDLYKTKNQIFLLKETHSSELLPLQEYAHRNKLEIKIFNNLQELENEISENTLIVSLPLVSNVTGEIFEVKSVFEKCKSVNAFSICDATSAAGHMKLDLKNISCDAAYFSLHKMCGPNGVGVLYLKREYSRDMENIFVGGGTVSEYKENKSLYRSDVKYFETGTQNIEGVIASKIALDYLENIGLENIKNHNQELLKYFYESLEKEENIKIKNNLETYSKDINSENTFDKLEKNENKNIGIISFNIKGVHSHDTAQILADDNVCVRSGHNCAQVLMKYLKEKYNVISVVRASFYFYNTKEDVDKLFISLNKVMQKFKL